MPPQPPGLPDIQIPGYELLNTVGKGAMATVYLARQRSLDREVAIKLMKRSHLQSEELTKRFQQEAETLGRLDHPHIVAVIDRGRIKQRHYFVMEYLECETLQQRLRDRRLTVGEFVKVVQSVGKALAAAHAAGIIHRDVKPSNVLMTRDGDVKLSDFGIAAIMRSELEHDDPLTQISRELAALEIGVTIGTAMYMSPEQAMDASQATALSDTYSMSVMIYEMLTGQTHHHESPPASTLSRLATARTDRILKRGMDPDPAQRHASAEELAREVIDSLAAAARRKPDANVFAPSLRRRSLVPYLIAVVTALLVVAIVALALILREARLNGNGPSPAPTSQRPSP